MGQSKPFRPTALVVEDDPMQREMICLLLEESDLDVVECASAEAAALVLEQAGAEVAMMMTDVNLAGHMDGVRARAHRQEIQSRYRCHRHLGQAVAAATAGRRKILVKAMGSARRDPRGGKDVDGSRCGRQGVGERSIASYPKMASCFRNQKGGPEARRFLIIASLNLTVASLGLGARAELSAPPGPEFTSWTSWPSSPSSPFSPSSLS